MGYPQYNKEKFIQRAKEIYGDLYDYSKVDFVNSQVNVIIICPKHGEFLQSPTHHLHGGGCTKCGHERGANKQRKTTEQFVAEAKALYGDKYDYSKVEYTGKDNNVIIICPEHGEFLQSPHNHLANHGCPKCAGFLVSNQEDFVKRATEVHDGKYSYEKVLYTRTQDNVCITCPKHGDFWMLPLNHLRGQGCPKCKYEKFAEDRKLTKEEFIEKARAIHGDKYSYDKVEYKNTNTKVCITCPKHGDFWMEPSNHLYGQQCCPSCKESLLERTVDDFLKTHNLVYEKQKRFDWMGRKSLDFYIPQYNAAIECQGIQHFEPVSFYVCDEETKQKEFEKVVKRDKEKLNECVKNDVKIFYYSNLGIVYPYHVYENLEELLDDIVNN